MPSGEHPFDEEIILNKNKNMLFPKKAVISVGVDNVWKGWVFYT